MPPKGGDSMLIIETVQLIESIFNIFVAIVTIIYYLDNM